MTFTKLLIDNLDKYLKALLDATDVGAKSFFK
jgi:hypothetical protein